MAKVTAKTTVFPYAELLRFLIIPKTLIKLFHTENAGLLCKSAVSALRTSACLVAGGLQSGHGKPKLLPGAVRALCKSAPKHDISRHSPALHSPPRGSTTPQNDPQLSQN